MKIIRIVITLTLILTILSAVEAAQKGLENNDDKIAPSPEANPILSPSTPTHDIQRGSTVNDRIDHSPENNPTSIPDDLLLAISSENSDKINHKDPSIRDEDQYQRDVGAGNEAKNTTPATNHELGPSIPERVVNSEVYPSNDNRGGLGEGLDQEEGGGVESGGYHKNEPKAHSIQVQMHKPSSLYNIPQSNYYKSQQHHLKENNKNPIGKNQNFPKDNDDVHNLNLNPKPLFKTEQLLQSLTDETFDSISSQLDHNGPENDHHSPQSNPHSQQQQQPSSSPSHSSQEVHSQPHGESENNQLNNGKKTRNKTGKIAKKKEKTSRRTDVGVDGVKPVQNDPTRARPSDNSTINDVEFVIVRDHDNSRINSDATNEKEKNEQQREQISPTKPPPTKPPLIKTPNSPQPDNTPTAEKEIEQIPDSDLHHSIVQNLDGERANQINELITNSIKKTKRAKKNVENSPLSTLERDLSNTSQNPPVDDSGEKNPGQSVETSQISPETDPIIVTDINPTVSVNNSDSNTTLGDFAVNTPVGGLDKDKEKNNNVNEIEIDQTDSQVNKNTQNTPISLENTKPVSRNETNNDPKNDDTKIHLPTAPGVNKTETVVVNNANLVDTNLIGNVSDEKNMEKDLVEAALKPNDDEPDKFDPHFGKDEKSAINSNNNTQVPPPKADTPPIEKNDIFEKPGFVEKDSLKSISNKDEEKKPNSDQDKRILDTPKIQPTSMGETDVSHNPTLGALNGEDVVLAEKTTGEEESENEIFTDDGESFIEKKPSEENDKNVHKNDYMSRHQYNFGKYFTQSNQYDYISAGSPFRYPVTLKSGPGFSINDHYSPYFYASEFSLKNIPKNEPKPPKQPPSMVPNNHNNTEAIISSNSTLPPLIDSNDPDIIISEVTEGPSDICPNPENPDKGTNPPQQPPQQQPQQQPPPQPQNPLLTVIYPDPKIKSKSFRINVASAEIGAKVIMSTDGVLKPNNMLKSEKDKYTLFPCFRPQIPNIGSSLDATGSHNNTNSTSSGVSALNNNVKVFVIQLSEAVSIHTISIANFEHFSSTIKDIQVMGSNTYPAKQWLFLGHLHAKNTHSVQHFPLPAQAQFSRFIKLRVLTHYGLESYCTISSIQVYGVTMVEDFESHLERTQKETQASQQKEVEKEREERQEFESQLKLQSQQYNEDVSGDHRRLEYFDAGNDGELGRYLPLQLESGQISDNGGRKDRLRQTDRQRCDGDCSFGHEENSDNMEMNEEHDNGGVYTRTINRVHVTSHPDKNTFYPTHNNKNAQNINRNNFLNNNIPSTDLSYPNQYQSQQIYNSKYLPPLSFSSLHYRIQQRESEKNEKNDKSDKSEKKPEKPDHISPADDSPAGTSHSPDNNTNNTDVNSNPGSTRQQPQGTVFVQLSEKLKNIELELSRVSRLTNDIISANTVDLVQLHNYVSKHDDFSNKQVLINARIENGINLLLSRTEKLQAWLIRLIKDNVGDLSLLYSKIKNIDDMLYGEKEFHSSEHKRDIIDGIRNRNHQQHHPDSHQFEQFSSEFIHQHGDPKNENDDNGPDFSSTNPFFQNSDKMSFPSDHNTSSAYNYSAFDQAQSTSPINNGSVISRLIDLESRVEVWIFIAAILFAKEAIHFIIVYHIFSILVDFAKLGKSIIDVIFRFILLILYFFDLANYPYRGQSKPSQPEASMISEQVLKTEPLLNEKVEKKDQNEMNAQAAKGEVNEKRGPDKPLLSLLDINGQSGDSLQQRGYDRYGSGMAITGFQNGAAPSPHQMQIGSLRNQPNNPQNNSQFQNNGNKNDFRIFPGGTIPSISQHHPQYHNINNQRFEEQHGTRNNEINQNNISAGQFERDFVQNYPSHNLTQNFHPNFNLVPPISPHHFSASNQSHMFADMHHPTQNNASFHVLHYNQTAASPSHSNHADENPKGASFQVDSRDTKNQPDNKPDQNNPIFSTSKNTTIPASYITPQLSINPFIPNLMSFSHVIPESPRNSFNFGQNNLNFGQNQNITNELKTNVESNFQPPTNSNLFPFIPGPPLASPTLITQIRRLSDIPSNMQQNPTPHNTHSVFEANNPNLKNIDTNSPKQNQNHAKIFDQSKSSFYFHPNSNPNPNPNPNPSSPPSSPSSSSFSPLIVTPYPYYPSGLNSPSQLAQRSANHPQSPPSAQSALPNPPHSPLTHPSISSNDGDSHKQQRESSTFLSPVTTVGSQNNDQSGSTVGSSVGKGLSLDGNAGNVGRKGQKISLSEEMNSDEPESNDAKRVLPEWNYGENDEVKIQEDVLGQNTKNGIKNVPHLETNDSNYNSNNQIIENLTHSSHYLNSYNTNPYYPPQYHHYHQQLPAPQSQSLFVSTNGVLLTIPRLYECLIQIPSTPSAQNAHLLTHSDRNTDESLSPQHSQQHSQQHSPRSVINYDDKNDENNSTKNGELIETQNDSNIREKNLCHDQIQPQLQRTIVDFYQLPHNIQQDIIARTYLSSSFSNSNTFFLPRQFSSQLSDQFDNIPTKLEDKCQIENRNPDLLGSETNKH